MLSVPFARERSRAARLASDASVSIDVDGLGCYAAIHGVPFAPGADDPIYDKALPRFLDACAQHNIKATLFVVGRDLVRSENRAILKDAHDAGHEIASHSHSHRYDLSRWPTSAITEDLKAAHDAIEAAVGMAPVGFRAPGYNQSEALFDALDAMGYAYDSSFFPTPAYFAARAAAIGLYTVRGRASKSLMGDVREFAVPPVPFVPHRRQRTLPAETAHDARRFVELPMSPTGVGRMPWLGTTIGLAPDMVAAAMTRSVLRRERPAIYELHAIDFAEAADGIPAAIAEAQSDLRVPLEDRLRRQGHTLGLIAKRRRVRTLAALARDAHDDWRDDIR